MRGVRADFPASEVEWLPPVLAPEKILCIGINYANRNADYGDAESPKYPSMFFRTPASLVGHQQPLLIPHESEQLDYEGEIALVIGRGGRRIAHEMRSITSPAPRCATRAPSATGSATANST